MKNTRLVSLLVMIAGAIMVVAGGGTWAMISTQLSAEKITVSQDAACQAGEEVNGPLEAYCMADIINEHALKATGGKTYAEMEREDPKRATAMNGSFLRASLFTSVLAFGVAAMAMGVGVIMMLIGGAIRSLESRTPARREELVTA